VNCYLHGDNEFNLRARLEDLIETERRRAGKKFFRSDAPMTFNDGSRLLNHAILVVRMLSWAWKWAEWWVEYDSNWEPLLEPGQKEKDMTKEQLKIVDSTRESRCADARRCRLAAFGAALRNRNYDTEDGFDSESLDRAFRAVLQTQSLVGPLDKFEIDFFADWLGRAYRSNSRLLGLGEEKLPVANDFCVHVDDKTPKFELGNRPLPGKVPWKKGQVFEEDVHEVDDLLKPETTENGELIDLPPSIVVKKAHVYKKESKKRPVEEVKAIASSEPTKKRGRPPKTRDPEPSKTIQPPLASKVKTASVAAMVPSAVKNRKAGRLSRDRSVDTEEDSRSRIPVKTNVQAKKKKELLSPRKDQGFPVLEVEVLFDSLTNPDGALRSGRRGRPPKVLEMAVVVTFGGEDFNPYSRREAPGQAKKKAAEEEPPTGVILAQEFDEVHPQSSSREEDITARGDNDDGSRNAPDQKELSLDAAELGVSGVVKETNQVGSEPWEESKGRKRDSLSRRGEQIVVERKVEATSEGDKGETTTGALGKEVDSRTYVPSTSQSDESKEKRASTDEKSSPLQGLSPESDPHNLHGDAKNEKSPSKLQPKRKRGRPASPKKAQRTVAQRAKANEPTSDIQSTRPRRARRAVMGLDAMKNESGAIHAESAEERKNSRRPSRRSAAKIMSMKETDSEVEEEAEPLRSDKAKRLSSRRSSTKTSLKEPASYFEPETDISPSPPRKRARTATHSPATTSPFLKRSLRKRKGSESYDSSYRGTSAGDLTVFSNDEILDSDYVTTGSSIRRTSPKKSGPSKKGNKTKTPAVRRSSRRPSTNSNSDPEDSLPISVLVASTRGDGVAESTSRNDTSDGENISSETEDSRKTSGIETEAEDAKNEASGRNGDADAEAESALKSECAEDSIKKPSEAAEESTEKPAEAEEASKKPDGQEAERAEEGASMETPEVENKASNDGQKSDEDSAKKRGRRKGFLEAARTMFS
jgi:hypothetical protein